MLSARSFSISVAVNARALYELVWAPDYFPNWALGLSESNLRKDGNHWQADGPDGQIRIRFTPHNDFGVMDHFVDTRDGAEIHVPLRIVENGLGAEVILTLFRQPDMDEERFAADIKLVNRDLRTLKKLVEG